LLCPYGVFTFFDNYPFQSENHTRSPFKVSDVFLPADPAFAVLQPDELLNHFPAAVGANPFFVRCRHDTSPLTSF
jgi:hypothetical protein